MIVGTVMAMPTMPIAVGAVGERVDLPCEGDDEGAAAGTSNRKIAEQMHVSVRTVEGHLYQVYSKLHVASRSELKDVISTPADSARLG